MRNIVLEIAYDGTAYHGWQSNNSEPTIESTLSAALEKILGEKPFLQAASRTDAGVHARGQIVNFIFFGYLYSVPFRLCQSSFLAQQPLASNCQFHFCY
ncbi:MAG TPA: hypothetical protein PLC42_00440 [Parachlamydiaceae bacterium]|nr:hypothetical protein [Parachlamydiaceae bacterium]